MKQMIEQNGRELRGEKYLKSLPISDSSTHAESIGRARISPWHWYVYEQKPFIEYSYNKVYIPLHTHLIRFLVHL